MVTITIDAQAVVAPLETWRHALGHGGINPLPLPERVVRGVRKLKPRWIRIFVQEFFAIYPERGRFDWSKLDPYMDALARTGAQVVAAVTIKPKVLYPEVDHGVWRPRDVAEWQHVVRELVRRYSVEKPIVTHWEIGNEPDIGEDGGSPYLIRDPQAYGEYYAMTVRPILEAFPQAKVGGPAAAALLSEPLLGMIRYCQQTSTQLDFLSWHLYHSDPSLHAHMARTARVLASELPRRPELFVTEWSTRPQAWNRGSSSLSFEEQAFDPRRAAMVAATILEMRQAGVDGSFYYHLWDQVCYAHDFAPFFSPQGVANMVHHWNQTPHRLGLFGVEGNVRPQYFVYQMLSRLGEEQLLASSDDADVRVLAGHTPGCISVLAVHHSLDVQRDCVATLRFSNLQPSVRCLTVYRIDGGRPEHARYACCLWDEEELELRPVERREIYALDEYQCQVLLPANSVAMVRVTGPDSYRR